MKSRNLQQRLIDVTGYSQKTSSICCMSINRLQWHWITCSAWVLHRRSRCGRWRWCSHSNWSLVHVSSCTLVSITANHTICMAYSHCNVLHWLSIRRWLQFKTATAVFTRVQQIVQLASTTSSAVADRLCATFPVCPVSFNSVLSSTQPSLSLLVNWASFTFTNAYN